MEAALNWLFGTVHRVPDGRSSSFTQPLLPLPPTPRNGPRPPRGVHACPLPIPRSQSRPRPATVGHNVDSWAEHSASYCTNSRGQRIFVQVWRPHSNSFDDDNENVNDNRKLPFLHKLLPFLRSSTQSKRRKNANKTKKEKAVVYIIHGLNDHSNKYVRVARAWVNAGYVVVAHDFHGHGRSDGFRAYTSSMAHYVRDARDAISHADKRLLPSRIAQLPKFLLAHSLGGAVAIHLARDGDIPFHGAMLTAPAVRVFPKPLLKLFAPVLATLTPLLPVQRLKFDRRKRKRRRPRRAASDGHEEDEEYCPYEDPLVVRSAVRARVGYEVLKSCEKIMSEADKFKLPVFVAHSAHDRVTNAKGTVEFHSRIASDDKTVKLYDGSVHDLLAEKRELVMSDMVDWASARL